MTDAPASPSDEFEQRSFRLAKREKLLADGMDAYPVTVGRTTSLAQLRARYGQLPPDSSTGETVTVVGRVMFVRVTGKLCFATLQEGFSVDGDVAQLQAMLSLQQVGDHALQQFKDLVDLGDQLAVTGEVITSRRGELSVLATTWQMAAKSLRPLPVAHKELSEQGRVRQRYVDLLLRPAARDLVRARAVAVASLRASFAERDYLEVETPMLQTLHGGAAARPFVTHINAYDLDLYLRIAPELYLKRCVVGGLERVFEINRNFRNEGADATHSPEFTMLEAYQAHGDYNTMAVLTRELIQEACVRLHGGPVAHHVDGTEVDLSGEWTTTTLYGSLSQALGEQVDVDTPGDWLAAAAQRHGVPVAPHHGPGKIAEELFEELVVPSLVSPTFVRDYPAETSPLTRAHRSIPGLTEKWDLYVDRTEVATAYSELVDPVVQRERFVAQAALSARGDDEAMALDEDFLAAMEHGMPPTGGMGMGVDRCLRLLTGVTGVRETILFPLVRPIR